MKTDTNQECLLHRLSLQEVTVRFWRKKMRGTRRTGKGGRGSTVQRGRPGAGRTQTCIPGWHLVEAKIRLGPTRCTRIAWKSGMK